MSNTDPTQQETGSFVNVKRLIDGCVLEVAYEVRMMETLEHARIDRHGSDDAKAMEANARLS
jgi:hypothetical protein